MQKHIQSTPKNREVLSNTRNIWYGIFGIVLVLIIGVGYSLFSGAQSHETELITPETTQIPLTPQETRTGEIETDTGRRIETFGNSGTQWGMNPFGSGKPLTEAEEEKPKFQKPNTEWKTRTLNIQGQWLTYEFGKGNPAGAKPLSNKEIATYKNCIHETELSQISCGSPYDQVDGYVTAELERDLARLLSHPSWGPILKNCEQNFRKYEFPEWGITYNSVVYGNAMNIENMISIDPETGRKELIYGNFGHLESWFKNALLERQDIRGSAILQVNNCITQNGGFELYRLFDIVHQKQFYPFGDYPERITKPESYIPWN